MIRPAPTRCTKPTGVRLFPQVKENALQAEAVALDYVELEQPEPPPWQRLGETVEFGSLLLRILALNGWKIDRLDSFGGVIIVAHRAGLVVQMRGETLVDIALPVFEACSALRERVGWR